MIIKKQSVRNGKLIYDFDLIVNMIQYYTKVQIIWLIFIYSHRKFASLFILENNFVLFIIITDNNCLLFAIFEISNSIVELGLVMRPRTSLATHSVESVPYCMISKIEFSIFYNIFITNSNCKPVLRCTDDSESCSVECLCDWFHNIGDFVCFGV